MPPHQLVMIDTATLQVLFNDLSTNAISALTTQVPEFAEAVQKSNPQRQPAPPLPPIFAMDTASDASGCMCWCSLAAGQLVGRYRCRVPTGTPGTLARFTAQNGNLFISSGSGDIFRYHTEPRILANSHHFFPPQFFRRACPKV